MTGQASQNQQENDHNQIKIIQWSVNGIPQNWHEIKQALAELNASITCIQESKMKPTDSYHLNISSYSLYRKDYTYDLRLHLPMNPGLRRCGTLDARTLW